MIIFWFYYFYKIYLKKKTNINVLTIGSKIAPSVRPTPSATIVVNINTSVNLRKRSVSIGCSVRKKTIVENTDENTTC